MGRLQYLTKERLPKITEESSRNSMIYDGRSNKCIVELKNRERLICVMQIMICHDKMDNENPYYCGGAWLDEARGLVYEFDESTSWEYLESEEPIK